METLWKDHQNKDSESDACCVKCNSFSPNSATRAGNRQPLLGALGRSQRLMSGPSKGPGPALSSGKDRPALLGTDTPVEQWPPTSAHSHRAGRHPSAHALLPQERVGPSQFHPRPAVTIRPGGLAAHTSRERPPGHRGVDQQGFTGCPLGIVMTQWHTLINKYFSLQKWGIRPSHATGKVGGGDGPGGCVAA